MAHCAPVGNHWPPMPAAAQPLTALALSQQLLRLRARCWYWNFWSQSKPTVQQLLSMKAMAMGYGSKQRRNPVVKIKKSKFFVDVRQNKVSWVLSVPHIG